MPRAAVVLDDAGEMPGVLRLLPAVNLTTGERHFRQAFGTPTSLEIDVLNVASAIYACDLAFKRGEREEFLRQIDLTVPVTNRAVFEAVVPQLRYALYRLSHDAWTIRFTHRRGHPSDQPPPEPVAGKVLLFSGGLDSLAGAIHLAEAGERVYLVSHVTANRVVADSQVSLVTYLTSRFGAAFSRTAFRVGGVSKPRRSLPFPSDNEREETQRTRSFLFLALAGLVAKRMGVRDIVMIAENGQMAIHLPLTAARISAFSTHTAHPEFVHVMGEILSTLLDYPLRIENPFLYTTKAEVVARTVSSHATTIPNAISCWKAARVPGQLNHCGFCVPCLSRRIAMEHHGHNLAEYRRDLLAEDVGALGPGDDGKRNLVELCEFITRFTDASSQAMIEDAFPDLINPHIDAPRAVGMYRRFAREARGVLSNYPGVGGLLA